MLAWWPASPTESANSRFSETPCLSQNIKWKMIEEDMQCHLAFRHIHAHTHTCAYTQMYTYSHKEVIKNSIIHILSLCELRVGVGTSGSCDAMAGDLANGLPCTLCVKVTLIRLIPFIYYYLTLS